MASMLVPAKLAPRRPWILRLVATPRVFISYAHNVGEATLGELETALETAGITVFRDRTAFQPCNDISLEIQRHIRRSHVVLCAYSERYYRSPWCDRERSISERHRIPRVGLFFHSSSPEHLPPSITDRIGIDLTQTAVPEAASALAKFARQEAQRRSRGAWAKVVVIAALLFLALSLVAQSRSHLREVAVRSELALATRDIVISVAALMAQSDARTEQFLLGPYSRQLAQSVGQLRALGVDPPGFYAFSSTVSAVLAHKERRYDSALGHYREALADIPGDASDEAPANWRSFCNRQMARIYDRQGLLAEERASWVMASQGLGIAKNASDETRAMQLVGSAELLRCDGSLSATAWDALAKDADKLSQLPRALAMYHVQLCRALVESRTRVDPTLPPGTVASTYDQRAALFEAALAELHAMAQADPVHRRRAIVCSIEVFANRQAACLAREALDDRVRSLGESLARDIVDPQRCDGVGLPTLVRANHLLALFFYVADDLDAVRDHCRKALDLSQIAVQAGGLSKIGRAQLDEFVREVRALLDRAAK
jgi:tetratricopeptide (TPR) repeat protein